MRDMLVLRDFGPTRAGLVAVSRDSFGLFSRGVLAALRGDGVVPASAAFVNLTLVLRGLAALDGRADDLGVERGVVFGVVFGVATRTVSEARPEVDVLRTMLRRNEEVVFSCHHLAGPEIA